MKVGPIGKKAEDGIIAVGVIEVDVAPEPEDEEDEEFPAEDDVAALPGRADACSLSQQISFTSQCTPCRLKDTRHDHIVNGCPELLVRK